MKKLTQHVEAFFSDICRETEERKTAIIDSIDSELSAFLLFWIKY